PKPVTPEKKPVFKIEKEEKPKQLAPKIGIFSKIKSAFSSTVTIQESEVTPLLSDLEMALLESDVSMDTTQALVDDLRTRLVGKQIPKNQLNDAVKEEVRSALLDLLRQEELDLVSFIKEKPKPVKILFLGPNGAGKTTTIAKIARLLQDASLKSVIAASDTFRAAAIEQSVFHGDKLGVKVVKHKYGADPAAVAFDAIEHAKANAIDVVLIDTAGRQETNLNLVKEMQKINRVINPDLRVFVGEAIAGHALVEQLKKFKSDVGVDAIVLTKLDCDAKGGSSLSIAHEAGVPVLYVGVGQEYGDLKPFDPEWLVKNIIEN
ncbi:MAG: signal recognition particle-docking protein FtsY, partial [Candidatus Micrarchaeota archaeon]